MRSLLCRSTAQRSSAILPHKLRSTRLFDKIGRGRTKRSKRDRGTKVEKKEIVDTQVVAPPPPLEVDRPKELLNTSLGESNCGPLGRLDGSNARGRDRALLPVGWFWELGYIEIQIKIRHTCLEPYLRPRLDTPKPPRTAEICVPHVSRMLVHAAVFPSLRYI